MEQSGYGKQKQIASLTAKYAMSKIIPLQMSYLSSNNASSARARNARSPSEAQRRDGDLMVLCGGSAV